MRLPSGFPFRVFGAALVVSGLLLGLLASSAGAQQPGPTVDVLEINGPLDRTMATYLEDALAKAERDQVEAVVVQLDSPGGLGVEPERLIEAVQAGGVPVAVWIGPPAARAAGAATYLAEAAHVLALGPVTALGPAVPAGLDKVEADPTAGADAAALLIGLAESHGRNTNFAGDLATGEAIVSTVGSLTDGVPPVGSAPRRVAPPDGASPEAAVYELDAAAVAEQGIADIVAPGLDDVLRQLDGRVVALADGERTLDVDPVTTSVRFNNPGLMARVLHTMASPTLVYLLLVAGMVTILFEVYQPGFGVAGITGLALSALSVYGLVVLPTRWWAFALVVAGLVVLAVDLAIAGLGVLTALGGGALTIGSLLLFGGPDVLSVPVWLVVAVVAFCLLFFVVIMTMVLRAQGVQAQAGAERVVGKVGVVRSMLNPEGHVFVGGALWRARAPQEAGKLRTGTTVRVVGMSDGLTLDVEMAEAESRRPVAK